MKKITLSAFATVVISGIVSADTLTLYTDPRTGQVFTTAGEGRIEIGDFVSAKEVDKQLREIESKNSEYQEKISKYVNVKSKVKTLEFSGTHYFGFTSADPKTTASGADASVPTTVAVGNDTAKYAGRSSGFDLRRNYVEVKGYFNDKDYWRVTLDATKELASSTSFSTVAVKYAYLYLDNILPYTGVEFGIAHRPWIDYEEHSGWMYRAFNKVAIEEKGTATEAGVDLVNSADLGINFKTKTENISSEIGIYNGEGYHADKAAANQKNSSDLSLEWRLTGHLIGSGEKVGKVDRTKETYAHLSTFGLISHNHKDDTVAIGGIGEFDRTFYGVHAVYNQPAFLIAAQYIAAEDKARDMAITDGKEYTMLSINAEYRPIQDWTLIGRYDDYKIDKVTKITGAKTVSADGTKIIAGVAYKYNKNVNFIGSAKFIDEEKANGGDTGESKNVYMLTTEVKW